MVTGNNRKSLSAHTKLDDCARHSDKTTWNKNNTRYQGVGLTFSLARNLGGQPNLGRPQLVSHRGRSLLASPPFGRPPRACHSMRSFVQYSNTLTQRRGPIPNSSILLGPDRLVRGPSHILTLLVTCRTAPRRPNLTTSASWTKF